MTRSPLAPRSHVMVELGRLRTEIARKVELGRMSRAAAAVGYRVCSRIEATEIASHPNCLDCRARRGCEDPGPRVVFCTYFRPRTSAGPTRGQPSGRKVKGRPEALGNQKFAPRK